jgi:hypothetical protein
MKTRTMKKLQLSIAILSLIALSHCKVIDAIFIDVNGNVSDNGTPVTGAIVLLVEGTNITEGLSLSGGTISNGSGDYTIIKPKAGKYYVIAIDDVNDNFKYDSGTDRIGFYGVDTKKSPLPDLAPNRITVGSVDLEGINIVDFTAIPL